MGLQVPTLGRGTNRITDYSADFCLLRCSMDVNIQSVTSSCFRIEVFLSKGNQRLAGLSSCIFPVLSGDSGQVGFIAK